jgi:hypothetical protein
MPIQSNSDYIPVMDEFIIHWTATDATLKVPWNDDYITLTEFQQTRANLDDTKASLQGRLNDLENTRVTLEQLRGTAGDRVAEFNRRIRADFPNNQLFNRLPAVPNRSAGRDVFISAMDDVIDLWQRVNAEPATPIFTPPMLLLGGMTLVQFTTLRGEVDTAFTSRPAAEREVAATRIQRDDLQAEALGIMKQYRLRIEALYAPDSVAVATLPRLTPLPGHTPDPVTLSGEWNPAETRADLAWTASTDPELDHYRLCSTPGPEYSAEDETVIATIPAGGPLTYSSTAGFGTPGAAVSYRLYVRLSTGNQAGSETVTITRPV